MSSSRLPEIKTSFPFFRFSLLCVLVSNLYRGNETGADMVLWGMGIISFVTLLYDLGARSKD